MLKLFVILFASVAIFVVTFNNLQSLPRTSEVFIQNCSCQDENALQNQNSRKERVREFAQHVERAREFAQHLDLPLGVKGVIINVGSNKDPPEPPKDNSSIHVIAVEPILGTARQIPNPDGRTHVIVTAIAGGPPRFQSMRILNTDGVSASLSDASHDSDWNTGNKKGGIEYVTIMPMDMLLKSIPEHIDIVWLKTDMQGFDFEAIKSAGRALLRVSKLSTEVYCGGLRTYAGVNNDLALDWMEYMDSIGFDLANRGSLDPRCLIKSGSRNPGMHEVDAEWVLKPGVHRSEVSNLG
jgi:hypothetical protein